MLEEDQDSLFGSPPPSPRFSTAPSASICDNDSRLSTSTDTQNVGTIALPGSHYSELPLNPLALSLNHTTVHRPPAQSQDNQATASQNFQPRQSTSVQNSGSENSRSSHSPFSNAPFREPEFSLPDPSGPYPAHFLRNQQNLLGKAGLVAGVKPSTIAHIRGTSFNPIVVDDEDTPILGRQSKDSRRLLPDPSVLAAPTNEDIVSVLIGQKDIFPVLDGILGIIGKRSTRPASTTSSYDLPKSAPIKKRKLHHVPAGAADWDVPYPFQEGDGPDQYHKTWERKRAKDLIVQLVKLIKMAARKAAIKNHLRKEMSRQAIWEDLIKPESQNQPAPPPPSQISFDSIISSLVAAQSRLTSSRNSTPGLDDFTFTNAMDNNNFDTAGGGSSASNTAAVPDDLDALIASMLNSIPPQDQGMGTTPVPSSSSSSQPSPIGDDAIDPFLLALSVVQRSSSDERLSMSHAVSPVPSMSSSSGAGPMTPTSSAWDPDIFTGFSQGAFRPTLWNGFSRGAYQGSIEGGGWDETNQITSGDFWSGMTEEGDMTTRVDEGKGKGKEVSKTNQILPAETTVPTEESFPYDTLMGTQLTDIVLPSSYEQQQPAEHTTTTTPVPEPEPAPPAPRPKTTTISQSRKEDILRRAREKRKQVQEELNRLKTQLWETTIEQAALVHLLKRYDSEKEQDGGGGVSIIN